jgi:hypothetical protein
MNKIRKIFASILVAAIFMSIIPAMATIPPAPGMWPMPQTLNFNTDTTNPGAKFNVTIHVATKGPSYTWQCKVNFNPAQIHAVAAAYTAPQQFFAGHGTIPVVPTIDNTAGFVVHGQSLVGADSVAETADSLLFEIEFEIVGVPPSGALTSQIAVDTDNSNTFVLDPDLNNVAGFGMGSATYTFTWSAPPAPTISVVPVTPDSNLFEDNTQHYVGTTFTDDIIVAISAAWNLKSLSTHLSYDSTLLEVTNVDFTGTIWGPASSFVNDPGDLTINAVDPTSTPGGNVVVAHVTFKILKQGAVPPDPAGSFVSTKLDLNNYALTNPDGPITPVNEADGLVKVVAFLFLEPPQLVVSDKTMGPDASLNKLFNVTVTIKDLSDGWRLVGTQFRLKYPVDLIEPVAVYQGPFFPYWASQQNGSLGTFFQPYIETNGGYGPHVLVGDMIFPNSSGMWNPPAPSGTGIIAYITFKVKDQPFGNGFVGFNSTGLLEIVDQMAIGLDNYDTQTIVTVPLKDPQNGTYTIFWRTPLGSRLIDVYGGARNSYWGPVGNGTYLAFPDPFGGQGIGNSMDLVEEQSEVYLHANVTYNGYPVQNKLVGFQIIDPNNHTYANLFAFSDENGVANITFRMPWPSDNPEGMFGVWSVISSVQLADVYINDTLTFHYDYKVHIFKVVVVDATGIERDPASFKHGEQLGVIVYFESYAQQEYPILVKVAIKDELGVVVVQASHEGNVSQATNNEYKEYQMPLTGLKIPNWAYAGVATVHVNIFDHEPMMGGAPWTPEFKPAPTIYILPEKI